MTLFWLIVSVLAFTAFFLMMAWRVVVKTNEVHVVQRRKSSVAYGKDLEKGNVYFKIPSFIPYFGVAVTRIPVDIFSVQLDQYEGYDFNKVPFAVDIMAFFQVHDAVAAAQRVTDFATLREQLDQTLKGGVRRVLAAYPIEKIMSGRSELSAEFVQEVSEQTLHWGVKVNSIEFMDIADGAGTKVISNIMDKERTTIEKESRVKVAENQRIAQTAEIEAAREVALRQVEQKRQVALETEKANQTIADQQKTTAEKNLAVEQTKVTRLAHIAKQKVEIDADAEANAAEKKADGYRRAQEQEATGNATRTAVEGKATAEVVALTGNAEASIVKAKGLAEAEAKHKMAEALKAYNDAGITLEQLKALIAIESVKWNGMAEAYKNAKVDIVTSGKGGNLFGLDLNAETGADLAQMIKTSGLTPAEVAEKVGGLVKKVTGK